MSRYCYRLLLAFRFQCIVAYFICFLFPDSNGDTVIVRNCVVDDGGTNSETEIGRQSHCGWMRVLKYNGKEMRGCILSCDSDACNSAVMSSMTSHWMTSLFVLWILYHWNSISGIIVGVESWVLWDISSVYRRTYSSFWGFCLRRENNGSESATRDGWRSSHWRGSPRVQMTFIYVLYTRMTRTILLENQPVCIPYCSVWIMYTLTRQSLYPYVIHWVQNSLDNGSKLWMVSSIFIMCKSVRETMLLELLSICCPGLLKSSLWEGQSWTARQIKWVLTFLDCYLASAVPS